MGLRRERVHAVRADWRKLADGGEPAPPERGFRPIPRGDFDAVNRDMDRDAVLITERAGVTKQTAGFLVDQLEHAGYVERVADPTDGRARLVRITTTDTAPLRCRRASWARWRPSGPRTSAPGAWTNSDDCSPTCARSQARAVRTDRVDRAAVAGVLRLP